MEVVDHFANQYVGWPPGAFSKAPRFVDETLREGDSRGYHPHPPENRLALLRLIHEVTGIRRFSVGFAVVNASERETLQAFLAARSRGAMAEDVVVHVYGWYQIAEAAHALLETIPKEHRKAVAFDFGCNASFKIASNVDAPWLARDPRYAGQPSMAAPDLREALAGEVARSTRTFFDHGLADVGVIIQDAFRCTEAELDAYVAGGLRAGAREIRLHDTVGVAAPAAVLRRFAHLREKFPDGAFHGHFHNDFGMAVANTIAALEAGAAGADLTVNGVGNRAGNADTASVLTWLKVVGGVEIPGAKFERFSELARAVEGHYGLLQSMHAPVTGRLLHLDEMTGRTNLMAALAPTTYLPFDPGLVGGKMEAAIAPGTSKEVVAKLLEIGAARLGDKAAEVTDDLTDRTWAWASRAHTARAAAHRPKIEQAMAEYEAALRASYVTGEEIVDTALRPKETR